MNRGTVIRWTAIVLLAVTATLLTRSCRANAAPSPAHAWVVVTGTGEPADMCGTQASTGNPFVDVPGGLR